MLPRRRFTLLIIPEEGGCTYEYKIPRLYLWVLAVIAVGVLGFLAVGLRAWHEAGYLAGRVERLERDKAILVEEVASIDALEEILRGVKVRNDQLRMLTAEAFGLRGPEAEDEPGPGERESFISLTHRLRYGTLSSVPTLKPVRSSAWSPSDGGLLLEAPGGSLVRASAAGRVDHTRFDPAARWFELSLDHGHGLWTTYAGIGATTVEDGDFVHKGQPLGLTARSRGSTPGLRFTIIENGLESTASYRRFWL